MSKNSPFLYTLYDKDDMPVLTTNSMKEMSKYLSRESCDYIRVQIWKYFNKKSNGRNPVLIASDGKRYTVYRFKEN